MVKNFRSKRIRYRRFLGRFALFKIFMEIRLIITFLHFFNNIIGLDVYLVDLRGVANFKITILAKVFILHLDMNRHERFSDSTKLGRFYLINNLVVDNIDWCASNFNSWTKYLCRLTGQSITILNVLLCVLLLGLLLFGFFLIASCHWCLLYSWVIIFFLIQAFQSLAIDGLHHLFDFLVISVFYLNILDVIIGMGKLQTFIV